MTKGINYQENKPLYNSIIMGVFYFFFGWSIVFNDASRYMFPIFMLFLPGLIFPLFTCYFSNEKKEISTSIIMIHLILSFGIYHGCVWIYTASGRMNYMAILAGFTGSLIFMLSTKFILKKEISLILIFITAMISGAAFVPTKHIGGESILLGLALFIWTVANGILLNYEFRKSNTLK